jgi:GGDEF domain-containing protein
MASVKSYISSLNSMLNEYYRLSTELQIVVCIALWVYIAILIRLIVLSDVLPSDYLVGIAFLILLIGLFVGPIIGAITALVCIVLMSPAGIVSSNGSTDAAFWVRSSGLLLMGITGGMMQRLICWLNSELYIAQHQTAGTDLPNLKASLKHLEKVLKSGNFTDKDLDVLNVRLSNLDKIRDSAGQDTVNELLKTLAQQLQSSLGEGAFVGQLSSNELLGIQSGEGRDISEVQNLVRELLAKPISLHGEDYHLTASTGMHRNRVEATGLSPQQMLDKAVKMAISGTEQ